MTLLSLLVVLLVVALIVWATRTLLSAFGVPEPINSVVWVIVVVVCVLWAVGQLGGPSFGRILG